MLDKNSEVSTDYDKGSSTAPTEIPPIAEADEIATELERYGTGKPKRVTIRAKITHDKG